MPIIIDLNDLGIRISAEGQVRAPSIGFATVIDGEVTASGAQALAGFKRHPRRTFNDAWSRLSTEPMSQALGLSRADLAAAQLRHCLTEVAAQERDAILIVPGFWSRESLSLTLGICKACGLNVIGLIDAAAANVTAHYVDQAALHIELNLHSVGVSRLRQSERTSEVDNVRGIEACGWLAFMERWLKFFAGQFVRQCRFDPLHAAASEQALFGAIPAWLQQIDKHDEVLLTLSFAGRDYTATISRIDVINAVAPLYQRVADAARALQGGAATPAIQMRATTAALPGFAEMLAVRTGGRYFVVADDAGVRHIAAQWQSLSLSATQVLRQMPVVVQQTAEGTLASDNPALPTHVICQSRAYKLQAQALVVGSGVETPPSRYLMLDTSTAGVSGMHCEMHTTANECVLTDRSRYGTFLNGNRISGSAALQPGDVVRVGTPGVELQLIREETI
ncbi:MAG: FHA domain-containing protein [Pseudomonadota bacterium]